MLSFSSRSELVFVFQRAKSVGGTDFLSPHSLIRWWKREIERGSLFFHLIVFTTTKIGIKYGGVWHPSSVSQGLHDVEFSLQVHVLLFGVKLFALRQLRPHLGGRHVQVQSRRTVVARNLQ